MRAWRNNSLEDANAETFAHILASANRQLPNS